MSIQITVRLPDDLVEYIDAAVAEGAATSRADVIAKELARAKRRKRALADLVILRQFGGNPYPDLDGIETLARRPLDID